MPNKAKLRLVQVSTAAWEHEDFLLVTDLHDFQIETTIESIIDLKRENNVSYTNEQLVEELEKKYPKKIIHHYNVSDIKKLSI